MYFGFFGTAKSSVFFPEQEKKKKKLCHLSAPLCKFTTF